MSVRVLVVTVVHDPRDARILERQIAALRQAGHEVVYAAPFRARGVEPPAHVAHRDLPRAAGRRRLGALLAARRLVRREAAAVDLCLVHDPELVVATAGLGALVPLVWDVHEDTAAAVVDKPWLPRWSRRVTGRLVRRLERLAERHRLLLLAEEAYQERFDRPHPVVPNTPRVPPSPADPGDREVVYVGRISRLRGAHELVELGRRLAPDLTVRLIGPADADVEPMLREADRRGWVRWDGFVPNDQALRAVDGALAGLSLLHDVPNYRVSLPTKVLEYLARGTPVVTTPLPPAVAVVEGHGAGVVVGFGDVDAAETAIRELRADPDRRRRLGRAGHAAVRRHHDWNRDGPVFAATIERWARPAAPAAPRS